MMERVFARFNIELNMDSYFKSPTSVEHEFADVSPEAVFEASEISGFLNRHAYSNLCSLFSNNYPLPKSPIAYPLSIEELEMLEAELINQGILNTEVNALSKRVRREISLLLWSGKRHNVSHSDINFKIDLRSFIKFEVLKLSTASDLGSTVSYTLKQKLKNELAYLDQFAAYLNGAFEEPRSGYERGLNLVLKAIMKTNQRDETRLSFTLPISKNDFIRILELRHRKPAKE